jgi:hypothetical protein
MLYISRRVTLFNTGTLNVIKSVLTSSSFGDTAPNELDIVDRRLAELASGLAEAPDACITPTPKAERLRALLFSVFPEPKESEGIKSLLAQGTSLSGETVCQLIRERFSR